MSRNESRASEQAYRILFMLKKFLNGRKYTAGELHELLIREYSPELTLRTVQRDLRLMQDCFQELEQWKEKRQVFWRFATKFRNIGNIIRIESNELLSFHVLKAHLKTFYGTEIERDTAKLAEKLEALAPGEAFLSESLYWDQNFGYFDYSEYSDLLKAALEAINKKIPVRITYNSIKQGTRKTYSTALRCMFSYSGALYTVAYFPKYDSHEALQLQGIERIELLDSRQIVLPEFDYAEFVKKRFGVFSGKMYNIRLKIDSRHKGYFEGRRWHYTQQTSYDDVGNLIMELFAPIGMDMVSWILGWNEAITILEPPELIEKVKDATSKILSKYE